VKRFFKKLGIFVLILITALVSIWYFYYWKRFSTLQDVDKQLILKSLKPDTTGKGYSDEGERMINHDIPLIKKQLSEKESDDLIFWRREYLKRRRIMMLSETKEKFLKNAKKYNIAFVCMTRHNMNLKKEEMIFKVSEGDEENDFYLYQENLIEKNLRFLTSEEIFNILNPIRSYELKKCFTEFRD
jgi:hypothetical protein